MLLNWDGSYGQAFELCIKIALAASLLFGLISDVRRLQIPNYVTLTVLVLFLLDAAIVLPLNKFAEHGATGGLALLIGLTLFVFGLMGAGDVKLIAALMLWAGPSNGPAFLIGMTFIGGLIAASLLIVRACLRTWPRAARLVPSRRVRNWATRGIFPYGIAICIAGLVLIPSFLKQGM